MTFYRVAKGREGFRIIEECEFEKEFYILDVVYQTQEEGTKEAAHLNLEQALLAIENLTARV